MTKKTLTLFLCLFTFVVGCRKKDDASVSPNFMKAQVDGTQFYERNCSAYPDNGFVVIKAYKRLPNSSDDTYPKIELLLRDFSPAKTQYVIGGSDRTTAYYYTSATERVQASSGVVNITEIDKDNYNLMGSRFSGEFNFTCGDNGVTVRSGNFTSNGWVVMCRSGGGHW